MVIWTIKAKRQLRHSLARLLCQHSQQVGQNWLQPIIDKMQQLNDILECTFPQARSVVVSDVMWRNRFAAAPDLPGQLITIDKVAHTIVGVMPAERGYPRDADVWRLRLWSAIDPSSGG